MIDINRLRAYERFHSYISLVPSTNTSGETEKIRGITHRANRRLRNILIEAAWRAVQYNPDCFVKYHELKKRMNSNKAIIRVAKQLASQIKYTLLNLDNTTIAA